ncbi:SIS domain-containing protein [Coxiella burnetii]|uniref:Phosphoheptose isomerase n=2 Tax=Coxiella burnetii TaxID=777 RepID=Q83DM5_COXBU|nr:SIS domain-containing protein [Coxiella burnetii]NP_819704.2 phosphoheptose isomerase [Coxiella burnetii RSA 493]AAO90218.2 phosphoheptose isomerase [Coxiella burnetii RSA 493]ABS78003.2 phosphoheptose isomerase [Coxiella burnetii Dugway 5J108-111]ACJ18640.1 phosphoheptose isomerase [Coxiella burnetii CbuG_Q212]ACJ20737.1 phosphoheptose isomerase [Coxiella burnetii CbuK_Q154]ARI65536.1 sugar isomerase [Coxiella burnetii]
MCMSHAKLFFDQVKEVANQINYQKIENLATHFADIRNRNGRLFILGVGGSAANASHAVNDFRKLCGIETYSPSDNISELTARTNDEGWETVFSGWLKTSRLKENDAVLVLSVGGGNKEKNVSVNLIRALDYAKECNAKIYGIVSRDGGYTAKMADEFIIIPSVDDKHITPHAEAFQAVIWHCLVSHPQLQTQATKW